MANNCSRCKKPAEQTWGWRGGVYCLVCYIEVTGSAPGGFTGGEVLGLDPDQLSKLKEMGMPDIPEMSPAEAEEALDILRDILNTKDKTEMAAKALGLAKSTQEAASKEEFYIFWINDGEGGPGIRRGITRDKGDGERLLERIRHVNPDAVIRWEGPMNYYEGRANLGRVLN